MALEEVLEELVGLAERLQEDLNLFGGDEKVYVICEEIDELELVFATGYTTFNPLPKEFLSLEGIDEKMEECIFHHKRMLEIVLELKEEFDDAVVEMTLSEVEGVLSDQVKLLTAYIASKN